MNKINNDNNNNNTSSAINNSVSDNSELNASNPYSIAALSMSIYELLQHLQNEIVKQENSLGTAESESSDSTTTSTGETTSSASETVSPYALAQMMAQLMSENCDLENEIAIAEENIMSQQRGILDNQTKEAQDNFNSWDKQYKDELYAESHRSRWQKFCHAFTSAFDTVAKATDKYDPAYAIADKIEDKVTGKHLDIETASNGAQQGMDYINEGLSIVAGDLSFGNTGLKIFMEILLAIAVSFAGGAAEAVAECFSEASAEVAAEAAAEGAGAAGGQAANEARQATSLCDKINNACKTVSKTGEKLAARSNAYLSNVGISNTTFSDVIASFKTSISEEGYSTTVLKALKSMTTFTRSESLSLFLKTYVLQNTGFSSDLAKELAKMGGSELGWEMAIGTTLSLACGMAGYQFATSFIAGDTSLFTANGYRLINLAQAAASTCQAVGSMGVGYWNLQLSENQKELGEIQKDMTVNNTIMQMIQQNLDASQKALTSSIKSLASNISSIGKALSLESAAGAAALEQSA